MTDGPNSEEHRRQRLIHYAARLFISKGYDAVSVDDIADAAGIGKASVYRLVGGKADLLKAVINDASRYMLAACRVSLDPSKPAEMMLVPFAEEYITAMYRPFAGGLPFYQVARLMISASFAHPDHMDGFIQAYFQEGVKRIASYLADRTRAGELSSGDTEDAIFFLQCIFYTDRAIAERQTLPDREAVSAIAKKQVRRFLDGCRAG